MVASVLVLVCCGLFGNFIRSNALITPNLSFRRLSPAARVAATATSTDAIIGKGIGLVEFYSDSPIEVKSPRRLSVEGKGIPKWIEGVLIRNGPGLLGVPDDGLSPPGRRFDHVFDGIAKLTRFSFPGDGSVDFSTRFLESKMYNSVTKDREIPPGMFTGPVTPPYTLVEKAAGLVSTFVNFDNACVNVHQIGGKGGPVVATTDAPMWVEFDPATLDIKGNVRLDFSAPLISLGGAEMLTTAHPKQRGQYTYNTNTEVRPVPVPFLPDTNIIHLSRVDCSLGREVLGSVEVGKRIPYIHDFSITDRYAVVCAWPMHMQFDKVIDDKGMMANMEWAGGNGEPTRIYVFDLRNKHKGPVASFIAPPLFAYHHFNAYEEISSTDGTTTIVVDVSGYEKPDIVNGEHCYALVSNIHDPEKRKYQAREGLVYRYRLPLPKATTTANNNNNNNLDTSKAENRNYIRVAPTILPAVNTATKKTGTYTSELMTINENFRGKKYRYSYSFTGFAGGDDENLHGGYNDHGIFKFDHEAGEKAANAAATATGVTAEATVRAWSSPNCYPTEPNFVANPNGTEEDDGVLLVQTFDGERKETFLLVLDARDMSELARCYTGVPCSMTFHGSFFTA